MLEDDAADFIKSMLTEIVAHESNNHWSMIPWSSLPSGIKTILLIWSFKRKCSPIGELLKHKARLCAHDGMQCWGASYWETYSPTISWIAIRVMFLTVSIIHDLSTSTIEFTLASPQCNLDVDVFMELPMVCVGPNGNRKSHVLRTQTSISQLV